MSSRFGREVQTAAPRSRRRAGRHGIEKVSTAREGVRVVRRGPPPRFVTWTSWGRCAGSDLGCTDPKAILGKDLAMIDIDQGPSPVAWPAVAGAG